jgi:hypothetical protein
MPMPAPGGAPHPLPPHEGEGSARFGRRGARAPRGVVHCSDIDLHCVHEGGTKADTRKNGTPYPGWPERSET